MRSSTSDPLRQRFHTLLTVLTWILAVVGVIGVVVLAALGTGEVAGTLLVLLYASVLAPLLVLATVLLAMPDPPPARYLVAAVTWGAVVSVALVLGYGTLLRATVGLDLPIGVLATWFAPTTEEPAKGLFLLLCVFRLRQVVHDARSGVVVGFAVGLGFAFTENVLYYASAYAGGDESPLGGVAGASATLVARGVASPFLHPVFTGAMGLALGLAVQHRSAVVRVLLTLAGLVAAMVLHGVWNGAASSGNGFAFLGAYALNFGAGLGLLAIAVVGRVRRVRRLWAAFGQMAQRRWIVPDEVPYLASQSLRRRARSHQAKVAGRQGAAAMRAYQDDMVRLAVLYDGVMAGRPAYDAFARGETIRRALEHRRPQLVFPPPVQVVTTYARRPPPAAWGGWPPPGPLPQPFPGPYAPAPAGAPPAAVGPPPGAYAGPPPPGSPATRPGHATVDPGDRSGRRPPPPGVSPRP